MFISQCYFQDIIKRLGTPYQNCYDGDDYTTMYGKQYTQTVSIVDIEQTLSIIYCMPEDQILLLSNKHHSLLKIIKMYHVIINKLMFSSAIDTI